MEPSPAPPHPLAVFDDLDGAKNEPAARSEPVTPPLATPERGGAARVVWGESEKSRASRRWFTRSWRGSAGSESVEGTRVSVAGDIAAANAGPPSPERPQTRRASGEALAEEAWTWSQPNCQVVASGCLVGCEKPTEKLLREVREQSTRHEHRVLELLEAHEKRLEDAVLRLLREREQALTKGQLVLGALGAGAGGGGGGASSQAPTEDTRAATPPQPPRTSFPYVSPARGTVGSRRQSASSAPTPSPRPSSAYASPEKPPGKPTQLMVGASPGKAGPPGAGRPRSASAQYPAPPMSGPSPLPSSAASADGGDRRWGSEALSQRQQRSSTTGFDADLGSAAGGMSTVVAVEEESASEGKPPHVSPLTRRRSRTETWNEDEAVGATELYRKKKVVEKIQRRFAATHRHVIEGSCSRKALGLISHPRFEFFLAIIIVLNATSIGVQADWAVQHVGHESPLSMRVIDYTFTVIFTFELIVRVAGEGTAFVSCKNRNVHWNLFDVLLVSTSIVGDVVGMFVSFGTNVSVIRLLRVLRLARAIRLIRVLRFFKDLRIMITGIAQSAKSLLWASGLLLIIIYMYAICVLQVVGDHLDTLQREATGESQEAALRQFYGSLPLTVYTLFGCISGGHDWAGVAEPLLDIHPLMGLLNMVYVGFAVFCVLNVITGVFVENAFKLNNEDEDKAVLDMLESRKQWIHEIKGLFKLADKSNTGFVDWAEFRAIITDVRVQAVFHRLGLDVEEDSAALLFELLDFGGTGLISLDDFAEGIQRVRGNARSIDMCQLLHDNRMMKRQLGDMMRLMDMLLCWQQGGGKMNEASTEV